jgi:phage tail sheath protein FI
MPDYRAPGVYVEELNPGDHAITGVSTNIAAFAGFAQIGPTTPTLITDFFGFTSSFGGFAANQYLGFAVQAFFQNGGTRCHVLRVGTSSDPPADVLAPLEGLADLSIVCCPDEHAISGMTAALVAHCERMRYRIAVLGAPSDGNLSWGLPEGARSSYAACYAPSVRVPNPGGLPWAVHPGGHIAGAMANSDAQHGVWKAPANLQILGISGLTQQINDQEQGTLNELGINALRSFPERGDLIWGARTTSLDPEWKYINIRRYFIYLEQSIDKGTQWAIFEPNGEQLWGSVRSSIEIFLFEEWRSGALLGDKPENAYFVRCDRTTMTQDDIDNGRLVCLIGVALLEPAEFVIFRIGQYTAESNPPSS